MWIESVSAQRIKDFEKLAWDIKGLVRNVDKALGTAWCATRLAEEDSDIAVKYAREYISALSNDLRRFFLKPPAVHLSTQTEMHRVRIGKLLTIIVSADERLKPKVQELANLFRKYDKEFKYPVALTGKTRDRLSPLLEQRLREIE